jgi:hypothetical protein
MGVAILSSGWSKFSNITFSQQLGTNTEEVQMQPQWLAKQKSSQTMLSYK